MRTWSDVAELIFPEVKESLEDLEKRFPPRKLKEGAMVTRFAPSPTGFLHTGSLFTALLDYKFAKQSEGVFMLRLEDTDQKREVEGSGLLLIQELAKFGVNPDEGYLGTKEIGNYGPYKQSERGDIYKVVVKEFIKRGKAYPCFCSPQDLKDLRAEQERNKIRPGYYGYFAKYKSLGPEEAYQMIKAGKKYIIRFRSSGSFLNKLPVYDEIRGDLELSENDLDIVIFKGDGLPTYHFAHLVDDHFMRTTHVIRGEEWLPSLPIHLDLFKAMDWPAPKYAHVPAIMKIDKGNRRKLSKRKDFEAAVGFFLENGYPIPAFLEYLYTIANSNYEEWRRDNKDLPYDSFELVFDKFSKDGALFDLEKIKYLSREYLASLSAEEFLKELNAWAQIYQPKLAKRIEKDSLYFTKILNIERGGPKPRKDYEKYADVDYLSSFFFEEEYQALDLKTFPFDYERFSKDLIKEVLASYQEVLRLDLSEEDWFNDIKELSVKFNFAPAVKLWKKNKDQYPGHVGDIAEMIRIATTGRKQSPNLYDVFQVLGLEACKKRLNYIVREL
ncbi:MAG: glutamate--tRNA ligase [Bacilli bacterium]